MVDTATVYLTIPKHNMVSTTILTYGDNTISDFQTICTCLIIILHHTTKEYANIAKEINVVFIPDIIRLGCQVHY